MTHSRLRRATLLALTALSASALVACSSPGPKDSVTVLGPWLGAEEDAFRQVLAKFTENTGIQVNYQGTRALSQVLSASLQGGTPPDVAMVSSPGELAQYARNQELQPLDGLLDAERRRANNGPWLLPLTVGSVRHIYTIPVKVNLKSIIWYPARSHQRILRTWGDLMAYSQSETVAGRAAWCMGMGDSAASGWPGTDMIEDILLHKSGADLYRKWAAGKQPWTSAEVKDAWITWGQISSDPNRVYGGPRAVLLTDFSDAGLPMFANPPGCSLDHQASFIMGFYSGKEYADTLGRKLRPGTDYDFFPFPAFGGSAVTSTGAWEISVDMAGMFRDTPQARELIQFLATKDAQEIWPAIPGGSAFTVNREVNPNVYTDNVSKRIDQILRRESAHLCFDASDLMPAAMSDAFDKATLVYLNDPKQLDSLLNQLEQVRRERIGEWLDLPCG
jgi:alpha-glucoside transport system substrate-binding protein